MIIGLVGFIGSGKDTAADYLVTNHGFRRESFANSLKDAVAAVFGWDRILLEGRTKEAREWREQPDEWWSNRLGKPITPRWILQYWGTEVCRRAFHDDIWIASLEHRILKSSDDIVISDCRFPNEISAIKKAGGVVIRVKRGDEPVWLESAQHFMAGPSRIGWAIGKDMLERHKVHASEYSWVNTEFDHVLDNNSTLDHLFNQVEDMLVHPEQLIQ